MDCRTCPRNAGDSKGNGKQPPAKRGCFLIPLLLVIALLSPPFLHARRESAHLTFQKTVGKNPDRIHVVKKGESLLSIIKDIRKRKPVSLALIRRLNPRLRDINRIYPGQKILLPPYEQATTANRHSEKQTEDKPFPYLIRESDSISSILLDKLKAGDDGESKIEEPIETYRKILKLNPDIADMNNLPAGRTLLLPPNLVNAAPPEVVPPDKGPPPAKTHPALRALLTSIGPAIERMKGSLNSAGSYFIPLQDATQISIDCSLIPSIELDDGTTVFLDYENRLNDDVKQLIRKNWHDYHFLGNMEMQGAAETLQGIVGHSQNYSMTRVGKPF
ncbi:MAG: LysM peptidoglycan-binding domain-containing protein, partial [Syntrophales bacterium]